MLSASCACADDWANSVHATVAGMYMLLFLNKSADDYAHGSVDYCTDEDGVDCDVSFDDWKHGRATCLSNGTVYQGECRVCIIGEGTKLWEGGDWSEAGSKTVSFFGAQVSREIREIR